MIDWHCHILPGIDDGPIDVSESIVMAARLREFGYDTVCCTPHCIKGYYDSSPQQIREATLMLQADLDNADIDLELWPGMEYCLDECFPDYADDLFPIGETNLVLCEAPQQANPAVVQQGLELIFARGFRPLIAHPERSELFRTILLQRARSLRKAQVEKSRAEGHMTRIEDEGRAPTNDDASRSSNPRTFSLWRKVWPFSSAAKQQLEGPRGFRFGLPEDCLYQTNLGSFSGYYGVDVQQCAYALLKADVFNALATDLHDSQSASQILDQEKLLANPLLQGLSKWCGQSGSARQAKSPGRQLKLGL